MSDMAALDRRASEAGIFFTTRDGRLVWESQFPTEDHRELIAEIEANQVELARYISDMLPPELEPVDPLDAVPFGDLLQRHPTLKPEVIHGLMRRGEVGNMIAATKTGKSFLMGNLAWSMAAGLPWLGFDVTPGRVLLIDNELHPETIADRLHRIAVAMHIDPAKLQHGVDVISLRGQIRNIVEMAPLFERICPRKYQLIAIDALYRCLPEKMSENDNAAVTGLYNVLDSFAATTDAAILMVHHSSKGQQGDKSLTDVGSGAGAMSRAPDVHIGIREHEEPGAYVFEARCRSLVSPQPKSIKYEWPLWFATTQAAVLKKPLMPGEQRQIKLNSDADKEILAALDKQKRITKTEIRSLVGMGEARVQSCLTRLIKSKQVTSKRIKNKRTVRSVTTYMRNQDGAI